MNLNGQWQFQIDNGRSGEDRGLYTYGRQLKFDAKRLHDIMVRKPTIEEE